MTKKQRIKELKVHQKQLKRYCHSSNKCNINDCPASCECKRKLDFDTAIAWEAAIYIEGYSQNMYNLQELQEILRILKRVLSYHPIEYNKLYWLIQNTRWTLGQND